MTLLPYPSHRPGFQPSSKPSFQLIPKSTLSLAALTWLITTVPAWASQSFAPLSFALPSATQAAAVGGAQPIQTAAPSQVKAQAQAQDRAAAQPAQQIPSSRFDPGSSPNAERQLVARELGNAGSLNFTIAPSASINPGLSHQVTTSVVATSKSSLVQDSRERDRQLFSGGADSLVAVAVGNAEGTRTPEGDRTPAYYGHRDPGNGQWNQGSFSFQHLAQSPVDADQQQLARIAEQAGELRQQARAQRLALSLLEELNGIDLANQAPLAALARGGYIDWLAVARQRQLAPDEAIIWARTWSYWDPDRAEWNAPGLGNSWDSIYGDQERRHWAIVRAMEKFGG